MTAPRRERQLGSQGPPQRLRVAPVESQSITIGNTARDSPIRE